jgi:uncharacterized protein YndB with AHSA1/START domain
MTTPDVPLRMELVVDVPGTPEQIWDAIATSGGISSWFLPTDLEEREGGAIVTHMGPEDESPGTVTAWDPPRRLRYEEPDWAGLAGQPDADVTPLVTEFLVEARSGGSCVVRVVSSAFGTGADWEREFFDEMEKGWLPFFDRLRIYLTDFPGQQATVLGAQHTVSGAAGAVWSALCEGLGVSAAGQAFEIRDLKGSVERLGSEDLLVRLTEPVPGFLAFLVYSVGDEATAMVQGQLFSADATAFVEREQPIWQNWLENLTVPD